MSAGDPTATPVPALPAYRGSLGDEHIRAVVRAALRAHGFAQSGAEVRQEVSAQVRAGEWLRDEVFPSVMPDDDAQAAYRRLPAVEPYVWEVLPTVAGFGCRQAIVVHEVARPEFPVEPDVVLIGAAFNAAIALLDYLVDEHVVGSLVFDLIDDAFVSALFADTTSWKSVVGERRRSVNDARVEVLLALISICVARAAALLRRSGNEQAWIRLADYVRAAYAAERVASQPQAIEIDHDRLVSALVSKSALPVQVVLQVSMLAAPHPESEISPKLLDCVAALGRAIGEIDDLVDLAKDCRAGNPSLLLIRLATDLASRGRTWACDADLYRIIGAAVRDLVAKLQAEGFLWEPQRHTAHDPAARLARFATMAVALWSGWDEDTDSGLPHEAGAMGSTIASQAEGAARMLLKQRNEGYAEVVHNFPMPEPARSRVVTFPSLLFQRTTVVDGLIDAHHAGLVVPRRILDEEALAILEAKHESMDGGWSYIPEMALLPPDADDLGIVLQVLHRIGGTQLAATCDEPVRLALDAAEPSGAVPTWIFGPRERCPGDEPARAYLEEIGRPGDGSQPEVVANFFYGLVVHDPARYRIPLQHAVSYLESVQAGDGHWESAWYAGRYYGTYRAVSVLGAVRPKSRALARAHSFLLDQQGLDGGWGEEESDPLSTAFAVLALASLGIEPRDGAAVRGVDYLLGTQESDGGWPAVIWGAFSTPYGFQTYGSRTITTTFALKALLAAERDSSRIDRLYQIGDQNV